MKKEDSTTVLSEHSKIITVRHILAIVNFIIIFACSLVTVIFANRRGAPVGVMVLIYLAMGINIVQILLCVADYVLKVFFGYYNKWLTLSSYIVGGVWLLMLIIEMITGSAALGSLRVDLLVIALVEIVAALGAYVIWPALDRKAIDAMIRPSVRGDAAVRNAKSKRFIRIYIILCAVMALVQIAALFIYKMPPKVYDLFSDTRAIEYRLEEDGYVVTNVYKGTSSVVNIPATFNNKPVVGIAEGAINDSELLEKNRISTITIGTPETDSEGNEYTLSYLKYIESYAITNDKIETLVIPSSVEEMGNNAISSTSLKTLQYEGAADFSFKYLDCNSLLTVKMTGEKVGNLVSLEGINPNCDIQISKDIYNDYRKNNPTYMEQFSPILDEGEYCIDFYTGCDYYIESIITDGSAVQLNNSNLGLLSVDTSAYVKDHKELGTDGAKDDSAFRGWYTDSFYTREFEFTANGSGFQSANIRESVSLYAKWVDEYVATLNWGNYTPKDAVTQVYWTQEEEQVFPVVTDRVGYADGISWKTSDTNQTVTTSQNLTRKVTLNGEWQLDAPEIDILNNYETTRKDLNTYSYTYDESRIIPLTASCSHSLGRDITYDYYWVKTAGEQSNNSKVDASKDSSGRNITSNEINVQNVLQSGTYTLYVTANARLGETSTAETSVKIDVTKKNLSIGNVTLDTSYESQYTSNNQPFQFNGTLPPNSRIKYTLSFTDAATGAISNNVKDVGEYTVKYLFEKNDADEAANYDTVELSANLTIKPAALNYEGWVGDYGTRVSFTDTVVYDGNTHTYEMLYSGVLNNDRVELLYSEDCSATDAGVYNVAVNGIGGESGRNYTLEFNDQNNLNTTWTIEQRVVSVDRWEMDGNYSGAVSVTYDGLNHSVNAVMGNSIAGDEVDFIYSDESMYVKSATDANEYTAKIIGISNDNYSYDLSDSNSEYDWTIEKSSLTFSFNNLSTTLTYDGEDKGVGLRVSGIASSDISKFTADMFDYSGSTVELKQSIIPVGGRIGLNFLASEANEYTAQISGLTYTNEEEQEVIKNYTFGHAQPVSAQFTINPKSISFSVSSYTYNGGEQNLAVRVNGLIAKDLDDANRLFGSFITEDDGNGEAVEGEIDGEYFNLIYKGTNAGSYKVKVTGFENSNYTMSTTYTDSITVGRKVLTVDKWNITDESTGETSELLNYDSKVYNQNGYTVSVTLDGIQGNDGEALYAGLEYTRPSGRNACGENAEYITSVTLDTASAFTNYTFINETVHWTITPYIIRDLKWYIDGVETNEVTYDGIEKVITNNFKPFDGDEEIELAYTSSSNLAATNANANYRVQVSGLTGLESGNYKLDSDSAVFSWTINPAKVTVNWSDDNSFTYNGEYQAPSFSLDGIVEADKARLNGIHVTAETRGNVNKTSITQTLNDGNSYSFTSNETGFAINATLYGVKVTYINNNYEITNPDEVRFTISAKPLNLSGVWNYANTGLGVTARYTGAMVYNSYEYTLTTSLLSGQTVTRVDTGELDEIELNYSDNANTNANKYTASVRGLSGTYAANYILSDSGKTLDWEIAPKVITFDWVENNFTYNGNTKTQQAAVSRYSSASANDYTANGFNDGKCFYYDSLGFIYSENSNAQIKAANYTATITGLTNSNYTIEGTTSALSYDWSIAPLQVNLSWSTATLVYNGEEQYPTATVSNAVYNDPVHVTAYTGNSSTRNAGENYSVQAARLDNDNYTLNGVTNLVKTFEIKARPVNLVWSFDDGKSLSGWTFDGVSRTLSARVSNICGSDNLGLTYTTEGASGTSFVNAGDYSVSVSALSNPNYTLTGATNTYNSFTITKRSVSLSWPSQTLTYDGNAHDFTPTVYGGCEGYPVEINYDVPTTYTNAGNYTINASMEANNNYSFNDVNMTFTINPQRVTIAWPSDTEIVYDGRTHSMMYTSIVGATDGVNLRSFAGNVTGTATDAGTYTFRVSSLNNSNYTLDGAQTGTLTITRRVVTLSWTNYTGTYDQLNHSVTATVTNAVEGETVNVTTYNNNSQALAGTYTVTATRLDNNNYTLDGVSSSGRIVINPKPVTLSYITLNGNRYSEPLEYTGSTFSSSMGAVFNDGTSNVSLSPSFTITGTATTIRNAGTYTVTTSFINNNYVLTGGDETEVVIKPKTVTINWTYNGTSGTSFNTTYSGSAQSVSYTVTGLSSSDNLRSYTRLTITKDGATVDSNEVRNAGVYVYTLAADGLSGNYTLEGVQNTTATLTINKAAIERVTWGATSVGNRVSVYVTGYISGNDSVSGITYTYTSTTEDGTQLATGILTATGIYTVKLTGTNSENYSVIESECTVHITADTDGNLVAEIR